MKKLLILTGIILFSAFNGYSQRFAYVDTEYILENIPEYAEAQKKLDAQAAQWQQEIETMYQEIEEMYKAYQAEQVLMTEEMKRKKEDEIIAKEQAVKELQQKRFGYEGDLFQKRQELVKPIQDKIYDAIQKLAQEKAYDFIFDKADGSYMLYYSERYNVSDDILKQLGYTPKKQ